MTLHNLFCFKVCLYSKYNEQSGNNLENINTNIYDYKVKDMKGNEVSLAAYKGKALLIVNTATGCGFTPQYEGLEKLYRTYREEGFEILDFPCNQFLDQAPGTDEEIHTFCTGRFGITFPQFSKIDVFGENAEPLFTWLCDNTTFGGFSGPMGLILKAAVKKSGQGV